MIRPTILRTLPRRLPSASTQSLRRYASATAPTLPNAGPTGVAVPQLPEGVEIDPQLNGYPQLPYECRMTRQPWGWDDMQERRNFGETLHEEEDMLGMWGPDPLRTSGTKAAGQLAIAFSLLAAFAFTIAKTSPDAPCAPRSYPYNGLERELGGLKTRVYEPEIDE